MVRHPRQGLGGREHVSLAGWGLGNGSRGRLVSRAGFGGSGRTGM